MRELGKNEGGTDGMRNKEGTNDERRMKKAPEKEPKKEKETMRKNSGRIE